MATRTQARKPYWEAFQGENGSWYIHLNGSNHRTVVAGGGYDTQANAIRAIAWVRLWARNADGPGQA